ncbi:SET domain-containing protein [Apiospora phragmitis]|uniref:SET domain-containing protein n=1 Tax=Apiospora phragmitis TaxID=2905665 RepID=A0ABR1TVT2_9PEZI
MSHPVNANVDIHACELPERGLGLFASRKLSKGLKVMSEVPFLVGETQQDMVNDIDEEFPLLPLPAQALFTRLFAGSVDMVPVLPAGHDRDQLSVATARLEQIVQLNSVEGAGTGCFLSPAAAAINHDCVPNTYVYYNHETSLVTLHALRDIQPNEEVTINYLHDNIYLDPDQRQQRAFHVPSNDGRGRMRDLRDCLDYYYQMESPTQDDTLRAISWVREIVELIGEEGQTGLELALCIGEQARLQGILGGEEGSQATQRRSMIIRRLCLGAEHPSCR